MPAYTGFSSAMRVLSCGCMMNSPRAPPQFIYVRASAFITSLWRSWQIALVALLPHFPLSLPASCVFFSLFSSLSLFVFQLKLFLVPFTIISVSWPLSSSLFPPFHPNFGLCSFKSTLVFTLSFSWLLVSSSLSFLFSFRPFLFFSPNRSSTNSVLSASHGH